MSKPDEGHVITERELQKLERKIAKVYGEAAKELDETIKNYFDGFKKRDAEMQKLIGTEQNGKIWTEQDYKQWRINQIGRGKRFEALRDKLADRMTRANEVAVSYVNDATPTIYSINRNYTAYTIEQFSPYADFILYDERTVKRLIKENPNLMPHYPKWKAVKRGIDLDYGRKQITSSVLSGILQGKGIGDIARDLRQRIVTMSLPSAIRTARTAVTEAQNAGRQDGYDAAAQMGIKVRKRWLATLDGRTRHDHGMLDGQTVAQNKPFEYGGYKLMFPGDGELGAPGYTLYNCRCTMVTVDELDDMLDPGMRRAIDPETGESVLVPWVTFQEWEKQKRGLQTLGEDNIIKINPPVTYSVSDGVQSIIDWKFGNGTTGGIRKVAKANIYTMPDGVQFVFPKNYNRRHQTMTPQKAVELYYKVPQELRDKGHRTIVFQDVYNPQDSYWRKTYKNFNGHSYATSGDEIVFWRYDYPHNEQYVVRTFCHEMTHKLDKALSQTTLGRFSMEQEWQDAMSKDLTATSIASITNYGENSPLEDFAESVAVYITDNSKMLPLSHRSAIIKRLLGF